MEKNVPAISYKEMFMVTKMIFRRRVLCSLMCLVSFVEQTIQGEWGGPPHRLWQADAVQREPASHRNNSNSVLAVPFEEERQNLLSSVDVSVVVLSAFCHCVCRWRRRGARVRVFKTERVQMKSSVLVAILVAALFVEKINLWVLCSLTEA